MSEVTIKQILMCYKKDGRTYAFIESTGILKYVILDVFMIQVGLTFIGSNRLKSTRNPYVAIKYWLEEIEAFPSPNEMINEVAEDLGLLLY